MGESDKLGIGCIYMKRVCVCDYFNDTPEGSSTRRPSKQTSFPQQDRGGRVSNPIGERINLISSNTDLTCNTGAVLLTFEASDAHALVRRCGENELTPLSASYEHGHHNGGKRDTYEKGVVSTSSAML